MSDILFSNDIDMNNDKLLEENESVLEINGNCSIHKVRKYEIADGEFKGVKYFVFDWVAGKAITNYNKLDYELLCKNIPICEDETIFAMSSIYKDYILTSVSKEYMFI